MTSTAEERAVALQAELTATRRLAALGTLTVPLAHELAGLLGAITSSAERALGKRTPPSTDHDVAELLAAASRARNIVEQLQRLARRQVKELVPMDLGVVASDGLGLLRLTIPGSIGLQVAIASELDPVLADPTAAHQVLVSLVVGSASTLRPGDALLVSVERYLASEGTAARGTELKPGRYVKLAVRSRAAPSGPGAATQGWGFELAVVEGILREHGGTVIAETSRDGTRSVACLFPALETKAATGETAAPSALP